MALEYAVGGMEFVCDKSNTGKTLKKERKKKSSHSFENIYVSPSYRMSDWLVQLAVCVTHTDTNGSAVSARVPTCTQAVRARPHDPRRVHSTLLPTLLDCTFQYSTGVLCFLQFPLSFPRRPTSVHVCTLARINSKYAVWQQHADGHMRTESGATARHAHERGAAASGCAPGGWASAACVRTAPHPRPAGMAGLLQAGRRREGPSRLGRCRCRQSRLRTGSPIGIAELRGRDQGSGGQAAHILRYI
jgi:hypothetical protein